MKQRVAGWLRRRPTWVRYVAGYLLIVLLLLAFVEYRGRPSAQGPRTTPPTPTHAPPHTPMPPHTPTPARRSPAPIAPPMDPSTGNPPAPPGRGPLGASPPVPRGGAHVAHHPAIALHVVCRGAAAPHLVLDVPGAVARTHTRSGAAWDLGPLGRAARIQFTLDVEGCR